MCYKQITHTLHCDVRPLVGMTDDVERPLVNPYATPSSCRCLKKSRRIARLQCEYGHSCCFMTTRKLSCRKGGCNDVVLFHKYVRRDISRKLRRERGPAAPEEGWAPLPVIDGDVCDMGLAPRASAEFRRVRELLLNQAQEAYTLLCQIKKTETEMREKSEHMFSQAHVYCSYLGSNWEQVCGYPTVVGFDCWAQKEFDDLDRELVLLQTDLTIVRLQ